MARPLQRSVSPASGSHRQYRKGGIVSSEESPLTRVQCPTCGASIRIDDAIAREFAAEANERVQRLVTEQRERLAQREQAISARETLVENAETQMEAQLRQRVAAATPTIQSKAKAEARVELEGEIQTLRCALSERDR